MPAADVVVVGGGLAGLAAGWQASRRGLRVVVLEASAAVGGRARQIDYPSRGALVAGGAGIGRKRSDRRLRGLLRSLRVPYTTFRHKVYYGGGSRRPQRVFLRESTARLRLAALQWKREERRAVAAARRKPPRPSAAPQLRPRPTFAALLRRVLGAAAARKWRGLMGFGDDERADGIDTALTYNFKDNFGLGIGMRVPWNQLAERLAAAIRRAGGKVLLRSRVESLQTAGGRGGAGRGEGVPPAAAGTAVLAGRGPRAARSWVARQRIVLALPASSASQLLRSHLPPAFPAAALMPRPQPFLLAYDTAATFESRAALQRSVPRYRVLPGSPLQKILPVNPARGVYMVAYADGERAQRLARRIGVSPLASSPLTPPSRCAALRDEVRRALKLPGLRFQGERSEGGDAGGEGGDAGRGRRKPACLVRFLPEGTHYYPPLPRARFVSRSAALAALAAAMPPGWFWVGEAVALRDQGWVEGALESVERELRWGRFDKGSLGGAPSAAKASAQLGAPSSV